MGYEVVDKQGRKFDYWNGFEGTPTLDKAEPKIGVSYQLEINFPAEDVMADEDLKRKESLLNEISKAKEKVKLKEVNTSKELSLMFKEFNG